MVHHVYERNLVVPGYCIVLKAGDQFFNVIFCFTAHFTPTTKGKFQAAC